MIHAPKRGRCFRCRARFTKGSLVWTYRQYQTRKRENHYYGSGCGCAQEAQADWEQHLESLKGELE